MTGGHRTSYRWRTIGVAVAVVGGLLALAAAKLSFDTVADDLTRAGIGWIIVAACLMAASLLARSESWYGVIRHALPDAPITRAGVRRGLLIGTAGSAVAPGRLGEAARTWVVARQAGCLRRCLGVIAGTVLAQIVLNLLALGILTAVAISSGSLGTVRTAALLALLAVPAGLIVLVCAGAGSLRRLAALTRGGASRLLLTGAEQVGNARDGLSGLRSPAAAVHAGAFQLGAWALQLATCTVVIEATSAHTSTPVCAGAAVLVAVNVTAIIPVTPSNIGVFQAATIAALTPFGVHEGAALACGIIVQAVEIGCALGLGIPALLREGLRWHELRDNVRAATDLAVAEFGVTGGAPVGVEVGVDLSMLAAPADAPAAPAV